MTRPVRFGLSQPEGGGDLLGARLLAHLGCRDGRDAKARPPSSGAGTLVAGSHPLFTSGELSTDEGPGGGRGVHFVLNALGMSYWRRLGVSSSFRSASTNTSVLKTGHNYVMPPYPHQ